MRAKDMFSNAPSGSLTVVDGDWIAYKVASALEKKSVRVYDLDGTFVKEYKTRTKFKEDAKNYNPNFTIEDCQSLPKKYKDTMAFLIQRMVSDILRQANCESILFALGGKENFRNELDLPQKYKGNRDDTLRPLSLSEVRDFIANTYPTVFSENEEADDIISKYQFLSYQDPTKHIVVATLDKDARGTPGNLLNPDENKLVRIEGLGFLERQEKVSSAGKKSYKLYGEGRKWFYAQLLTGDKADNYFPCDYYKTVVGNDSKSPLITDLKCFNMLNECKTDAECWNVIVQQYREWYGQIDSWVNWKGETVKGTWIDILQVYVDVVHMRRFDNDRVDVRTLLTKFGLI
jgi:hypothetical protein